MIAVARWAVRRPGLAVLVWLVVLAAIGFGAARFAGSYDDSFSLPDTESTRATTILSEDFPQAAAPNPMIVFSPSSGTIFDPIVAMRIMFLADQISAIPGVKAVQTPYADPQAAAAMGLIGKDAAVGRAIIVLQDPTGPVDVANVQKVILDVESANSPDLAVGVAGQVIEQANTKPPSSEAVGVLVAVVILLVMFGSLVAAGLPIVTALVGMGAGLALVTIAARFMGIASFGPTLAAMIGLGVGIDYALFVINRYRQGVAAGRDYREAATEAVNTAGRAIAFAGTTVVIALGGLFVLGISFMNGLAVGAAVTVIMVMLTAVTLLPAVISLLGKHTFAVRMPWARGHEVGGEEGRHLTRYARAVQKWPWLFGGVALLLMLALAAPTLSMRLGFPDAGGYPPGNTSRIAYDLTSKGFGTGANGPFLVAVDLPQTNNVEGAQALSQAIAATPGVAYATPVVAGTRSVSADGTTAIISVLPTTGPQDPATTQLLKTLRNTTIPPIAASTGITAYVGGATAVTADFTAVLAKAIPAFLAVVVGLGFLALMALFRSLLIPLTAALTSLLSLGAALGATVAVFQWGHFDWMFGVSGTGPILPFLPVMLFAILFGLSMDYQVFLVSRMQEEWLHTHNNRVSVRRGLVGSGRVVMAAAAIMFAVFISFVFGDNDTIKMFGLALAIAVALDAFVIRMAFVPSLMSVLGSSNWYLPKWLGRILPTLTIEGELQHPADTDDPDGPGASESAAPEPAPTAAP